MSQSVPLLKFTTVAVIEINPLKGQLTTVVALKSPGRNHQFVPIFAGQRKMKLSLYVLYVLLAGEANWR